MVYRRIIRPLLFLIPPETVHSLVVACLKIILRIPGLRGIICSRYNISGKRLERTVFGIRFRNPVGLAAGFDKNAEFYKEMACFGFSFIEIGTVTPLAQSGNPRPRSFRLTRDRALINRMGMNNHGVRKIAENLRKNSPGVIIGGNIGKNTVTPNDNAIDDYVECFNELHEVVDYFVVNVSCPNIGDITKLQGADTLMAILGTLKKLSSRLTSPKPVLLKISPDLNEFQLDDVVQIALETQIDGFVATNTTVGRYGLQTDMGSVDRIGKGGMSGLPLRDRSTEVIRYLSARLKDRIPIIGVGGIMNPEDAIEKLAAGATLVQVYTGFIYEGPGLVKKINKAVLASDGG
jgi:dihydroorotate dehydrogenase